MTSTTGPQRDSLRPAVPAGARHGSSSGFTLLELVFVLIVAGIAAMMAAPLLGEFLHGTGITHAAESITGLARHARARATAEARLYRLRLDAQAGSYWLEREEDARYVALGTGLGRTFLLPESATLTFERSEGLTVTGEPSIQFFPDGTQTPTSLRLQGRRGEVIRLVSATPSDELRVVQSAGVTP